MRLRADALHKVSNFYDLIDLAGVGGAAGAFVGIVASKSWRRAMKARSAILSAPDRPIMAPDLAAIRAHDGTFDAKDFVRHSKAVFHRVQDARKSSKLGVVRQLMAPDLWAAFDHETKQRSQSGRRVVVSHLKLHRATVQSAINIRGWDSITVRMVASCAEYEVDGGGHLFGDRKIRAWREDWTFQRSTTPDTRLRETWSLVAVTPVMAERFDHRRRASVPAIH